MSQRPYRTNRSWHTSQRQKPRQIWVFENELFTMIRSRRQWPDVERTCLTQPKLASCEERDSMGNTVLHLACRWNPPVTFIEAVIQADPRAVSCQNECGCVPLHLACLHKASPEVISVLLQADPASASICSNKKRTPVHYACHTEGGLPVESFRLVVEAAAPNALVLKDVSGQDTLCLLFDANKELLSEAVKAFNIIDPIVGCHGVFWEKVSMLIEPPPSLKKLPSDEGSVFDSKSASNLVHTLFHHKDCHPMLIYYAIFMHPYMSETQDDDGNLPLHIVCRKSHSKDEETNQVWRDMFSLLLKRYPNTSCTSNKDGKLPLDFCIESGKGWKNEIELIFHAHPTSILRQGTVNFTCFPHILSLVAAEKGAGRRLGAVFEMLRGKPDLMYLD
mmetsp:Transcript_55681/g.82846  ORF Transcript_55681/g.82846 Transcript_55681/m.82846 type:complete len:391 (+) Transcript_55681:102-1274(+)